MWTDELPTVQALNPNFRDPAAPPPRPDGEILKPTKNATSPLEDGNKRIGAEVTEISTHSPTVHRFEGCPE